MTLGTGLCIAPNIGPADPRSAAPDVDSAAFSGEPRSEIPVYHSRIGLCAFGQAESWLLMMALSSIPHHHNTGLYYITPRSLPQRKPSTTSIVSRVRATDRQPKVPMEKVPLCPDQATRTVGYHPCQRPRGPSCSCQQHHFPSTGRCDSL